MLIFIVIVTVIDCNAIQTGAIVSISWKFINTYTKYMYSATIKYEHCSLWSRLDSTLTFFQFCLDTLTFYEYYSALYQKSPIRLWNIYSMVMMKRSLFLIGGMLGKCYVSHMISESDINHNVFDYGREFNYTQ